MVRAAVRCTCAAGESWQFVEIQQNPRPARLHNELRWPTPWPEWPRTRRSTGVCSCFRNVCWLRSQPCFLAHGSPGSAATLSLSDSTVLASNGRVARTSKRIHGERRACYDSRIVTNLIMGSEAIWRPPFSDTAAPLATSSVRASFIDTWCRGPTTASRHREPGIAELVPEVHSVALAPD
jgi:hypothetical protein